MSLDEKRRRLQAEQDAWLQGLEAGCAPGLDPETSRRVRETLRAKRAWVDARRTGSSPVMQRARPGLWARWTERVRRLLP